MLLNILKNTFAILVSLIFVGSAYFFVIKGGEVTFPWSSGVQEEVLSADVVGRLNERLSNLKTIDINTNLFTSNEFKALDKNYKQPLPILIEGEVTNPFESAGIVEE